MSQEDKISIDTFKIIARAIAESYNLRTMLNHMTQLLVGALSIKGCSLLLLEKELNELERVATFGLSLAFLEKGPVRADRSAAKAMRGEAIVIRDVNQYTQLQYPKETLKEGIGAMVSIPIPYLNEIMGVLRLYHSQTWDISERDVDTLGVLAELIGIAIMHTRYLNGLQSISETLGEFPRECIPPFKG